MTFTPTATAVPTFTPRGTELNPVPVDINIGPPNGPFGFIQDGYYAIMDLTSSPIVVTYPPDANYDFVYYEQPFPVDIQMDTIVMGISVDGLNFYEVFNWSNDIPDYNSNIWNVAVAIGAELDNQLIAAGNLYGTVPYQAGILIDVDNAPSYPPAGSYRYLILEAPAGSGLDPGTDVDAIQIIEVPLPP